MPQQLADLTLAEVEDFVATMVPVLAPIFGAVGVCRYPTKPLARAVQVHGWVSKRVSLAVESRAEVARQQAFAPTMLAPTMAMSVSQPIARSITLDLPTHVLRPEPISPPSSQASPQSSQPQTGEHAAELTPNTVLVQPIADLALPEDLSESETAVTVVSSQRRASIASEDAGNVGTSDDATKDRARRSSAQ